jgi:hypothetical protein
MLFTKSFITNCPDYFDSLIQALLTDKTIGIERTTSGGNTSLMT